MTTNNEKGQRNYPLRQELRQLREHVHEASVLAGRMSEAVSAGLLPAEMAMHVASLRGVILSGEQFAAVLAMEAQRLELPE